MAENKKGFMLYADQKALFDKLPNDLAGELIKHIFSYVNDENPQSENLLIEIAFEPIKQQLKRDLIKYKSTCDRNRINGSKGGRPKNPTEPKKPSGFLNNPTEPKKPDIDNDKEKDIDNDKEKDIININTEKDYNLFLREFHDEMWFETLAMQYSITPSKMIQLVKEFERDRKADCMYNEKSKGELRSWFVNFIKKNKEDAPENIAERVKRKLREEREANNA